MREELRGTAAVIGAVAIWGVTFSLTKTALHHFAPVEVAFLRSVFAIPPLLYLAWLTGRLRAPLRLALPLSLTGMVGFFLFTNLGLDRASASVGALVQGTAPVLTALLAAAFLGERPGRRVALGIALAVSGAAVLAWGALRVESPLGLLFLALSALSWAIYPVLIRRYRERLTPAEAVVVPSLLSTAAFAAGPAFEDWTSAGPGPWLLVAAIGFFGSGVAYLLWSFGVARIPATSAGVYSNLFPVVSVVVAAAALGESLGAREALGGTIVISGAVLASTRTLRPRPATRALRPRSSATPEAPRSSPEAS